MGKNTPKETIVFDGVLTLVAAPDAKGRRRVEVCRPGMEHPDRLDCYPESPAYAVLDTLKPEGKHWFAVAASPRPDRPKRALAVESLGSYYLDLVGVDDNSPPPAAKGSRPPAVDVTGRRMLRCHAWTTAAALGDYTSCLSLEEIVESAEALAKRIYVSTMEEWSV